MSVAAYVLCGHFDKVRVFDVVGDRRIASREQLVSDDTDGTDGSVATPGDTGGDTC